MIRLKSQGSKGSVLNILLAGFDSICCWSFSDPTSASTIWKRPTTPLLPGNLGENLGTTAAMTAGWVALLTSGLKRTHMRAQRIRVGASTVPVGKWTTRSLRAWDSFLLYRRWNHSPVNIGQNNSISSRLPLNVRCPVSLWST